MRIEQLGLSAEPPVAKRSGGRLVACGVAAASLGTISLGGVAHAAIQSNSTTTQLSPGGADNIDFNGDGTDEITVYNDTAQTGGDNRYYVKNLNTTEAAGYAVTNGQVADLTAGTLIGPGETYSSANGDESTGDYTNNLAGTPGGGNFPTDDSTQYIGVEFTPTGSLSPDYGWISVQLDPVSEASPQLYVTGYAFDDSGAPIAAGQTVASVPEPTGLALLALGAVGIIRRKRTENN